METYRGKVIKVDFPGPADATGVTAAVTYWGKSVDAWQNVTESVTLDQTNALTLQYKHVYQSDKVVISWSWDDFTVTQNVFVVNPILDMTKLGELLNETDQTKLGDFERKARLKIESYTGQHFNMYHATKTFYGRGGSSMELPDRLIAIDSLTAGGVTNLVTGYKITGDRRFISTLDSYTLPDTEYYANPIGFPCYKDFSDQVEYSISGAWGWEDVPEAVQQAGLIIAAGFACNDDKLRDKYVASLRTNSFSITFNPRAFDGTGSQDADILLDPYVYTPLLVV